MYRSLLFGTNTFYFMSIAQSIKAKQENENIWLSWIVVI